MRLLFKSGIMLALMGVGCNQNEALDKRISAFETRLAVAELSISALEKESNDNPRPRTSSFTPNVKGYGTIYSDNGMFLISLTDLKPYANGYKATFDFGNPQAAAYDDGEVEIEWGPAQPSDGFKTIKYLDWRAQFQQSTQKLGKRLQGDSWNPIEVVLAPATAEQVGSIEIKSLKTPSVFMRLN